MEQINTYIAAARQSGYTDDQIRQSLLTAGWQADQVDSALGASGQTMPPDPAAGPTAGVVIQGGFEPYNQAGAPVTPATQSNPSPAGMVSVTQPFNAAAAAAPKQRNLKLAVILSAVVTVLLVAGIASYVLLFHKTSYQSVAEDFVTAMQRGDKAKANALTNPKFKALLKQYSGTDDVYTSCKKAGTVCTYYFTPAFLNKAAMTTKNEASKNGVQKRAVIYTLKQSSTTKTGDCSSSGSSTQTLTIELESKGRSWLVDNADPETNFSAGLCPTSGGTDDTGGTGNAENSGTSSSTGDDQSFDVNQQLPSVSSDGN